MPESERELTSLLPGLRNCCTVRPHVTSHRSPPEASSPSGRSAASLLVDGELPAPTLLAQAVALLGVEGASIGLASWMVLAWDDLPEFVRDNMATELAPFEPLTALMVGAAVLLVAVGGPFAVGWCDARRLNRAAWLLLPFSLSAFVPLCFNWRLWVGRELVGLVLMLLVSLGLERSLRVAGEYLPPGRFPWRWPWSRSSLTLTLLGLIAIAGAGYAWYFSHHTIAYHLNGHTSTYDLGIEENIVWHTLHGGPLFRSTPIYGPGTTTHFSRHATFIAFLVAPFYSLYQHPETLLVLQSVICGAAAIPLFLLARRQLGAPMASVLALAYLLYAPLHGAHLYDFHFLTLVPLFVWATVHALLARRDGLAAFLVVLTLSVREDVSLGLGAFGAYLLLSGLRPRAGATLLTLCAAYFLVMKFVFMPPEGNRSSFVFFYEGLLASGSNDFEGVLQTLVTNPGFILKTLLFEKKVTYALLIFVPLLLLPLRRPFGWLLLAPAFVLTLLSHMKNGPAVALVSISFQYTSQWTPYVFIGAIFALGHLGQPRCLGDRLGPVRRGAALLGLVFASLAVSYQFGAVLQQNTARAGFDDFVFGTTSEDLARREARSALVAQIPRDASVSASERELPHVANRAFAYTLRSGVYDAEYVLFAYGLPWTRPDDMVPVRQVLGSNEFGVVDEREPFVLLRRGAPPDRNAELLRKIGQRRPSR